MTEDADEKAYKTRLIEEMFEEDFLRSVPVAADEYSGRSFWFRLAVRLARLTSPLL